MTLPTVGAVLSGTVVTMDDEGRGRLQLDGAELDVDIAVRGAFLDEVVEARVERVFPHSGVAQARVLRVIVASPARTARTCPHAAPCPACPLHGLVPEIADDLKRARIQTALDAVSLRAPIAPTRASRSPRQKVKLMVADGRVGVFVPHSHVLIDADQCAHHHEAITAALRCVRPLLRAPIHAVVARAFHDGVGITLASREPLPDAAWTALVACLKPPLVALRLRVDETHSNSVLGGRIVRSAGPTLLTPLDGGPPCDVDGFCQPDAELARALYQDVADFLVKDGATRVADLYAGAGGFSRALLAAGAKHVLAVERAAEGVASLTHLRTRHVPNASDQRGAVVALASSVEDAVPQIGQFAPQAFVADPPKKGLASAGRGLAALGAERVALVACDPDAGARDARVFVDTGYQLLGVQPFDLFPGTTEIEAVFQLIRSGDVPSAT